MVGVWLVRVMCVCVRFVGLMCGLCKVCTGYVGFDVRFMYGLWVMWGLCKVCGAYVWFMHGL